MKRALIHSRASRGRLRRSTSSHKCTALARQYLFVIGNSPEFPVITSENTLREFPLVIATVAKVSRKRGLWLVVRVKKGDTRRYLHFYSFSSAASYVGMIQIRYTGLGDAANSQPDPSGSPVCLFSFLTRFTIYFLRGKVKFAPGFVHDS